MKIRLLLLAILCLPLFSCKSNEALAQATGRYDPYIDTSFSETQACAAGSCTRASAPVSTAEGMSLVSVNAYRVSLCAASGQTLSGAGTMQMWWCDSVSTLCFRSPAIDFATTISAQRCMDWDINNPMVTSNPDSVVAASSGVTVSGGANLTVRIYSHKDRYKQ